MSALNGSETGKASLAAARPGAAEAGAPQGAEAQTGPHVVANDAADAGEAIGHKHKSKKKRYKHKLHVAHHTPGRVRMKIPSAKGDLEALRQMGEAFGVLPGVERVTINADTGSIVLHYDHEDDQFHDDLHRSVHGVNGSRPPETELDQLVHKIEDEAKFLAEHSHTARLIVGLFSDLDREIRKSTNNNADLKLALAASVVGVTVLEIGMTAATPVWLTLSVFTLNHFVELHQPRRQPASARAPMAFKKAR